MPPNFFIIGAPKCGTTSMSKWLSDHPQIFMSPIKEPHYFNTDMKNRSVKSIEAYKRLFSGVGPHHRAIGEASTWYLYSHDAVPAIEATFPDSRYIVMTRDPVEMAISLHHHNLRVLHETEPDLEVAWRLQEDRLAGRCIPDTCSEPRFLQYRGVCALGSQLTRLYQQVEAERVLHITMDSLKKDPGGAYRRALDFLKVEDDGRKDFSIFNEARGHVSPAFQKFLRWGGAVRVALGIKKGFGLGRLNERPSPKKAISDCFREELNSQFLEEKALMKKFHESCP